MCYLIQVCPSKLKILHIRTCAVLCEIHTCETDQTCRCENRHVQAGPQSVKLAGSHICKSFRWSLHMEVWWIYGVLCKLNLYGATCMWKCVNPYFTYFLYVYVLKSPCSPHMCQPTQYSPTCSHMDLISRVNLYIQTCRSVQISENAYPGSPAPPEL